MTPFGNMKAKTSWHDFYKCIEEEKVRSITKGELLKYKCKRTAFQSPSRSVAFSFSILNKKYLVEHLLRLSVKSQGLLRFFLHYCFFIYAIFDKAHASTVF